MERFRLNDPGFLLLVSLAGGAKHGHAMLLDVQSFAGVRLGPGTLYGALSRLEERSLIRPLAAAGRRQPYEITERGLQELSARLDGLARAVNTGLRRVAP